ncbi:MAG: DUF2312 domain-containing protein [Reyranella sp.]|jgi:uncharacterized protein (UPF0335 family)|nr:DUF2312 domain-containing protein [Reyranella sp.]
MMTTSNLPVIVKAIEDLEAERQAIGVRVKDTYKAAKAEGRNIPTLKKVIAIRAMDPAEREAQETRLAEYLAELGMRDRVAARLAAGESIRDTAAAEGVSKSTAHRLSQKPQPVATAENGTAVPDENPLPSFFDRSLQIQAVAEGRDGQV